MTTANDNLAGPTCIICDYNLHGLPSDGKCPECGNEIALSLSGDRLINANPFWLQRIALAALLLSLASAVHVFTDSYDLVRYVTRLLLGNFREGSLLNTADGVFFLSLWLLASPERFGSAIDGMVRQRRGFLVAMRSCVLFAAVAQFILPDMIGVAYLLLNIAIGVLLAMEIVVLRPLARRLGSPFLYRATPFVLGARLVLWSVSSIIPIVLEYLGIHAFRSRDVITLLEFLWCGSGIFTVVLLFRYWKLLHQAAETAASRWLRSQNVEPAAAG